LTVASRAGVFGRCPCEAAIQSVHAQRPLTGRTNHAALAMLYALLAARCPGVSVLMAQADAMLEAGDHAQVRTLAVLARLVAARRRRVTGRRPGRPCRRPSA
jgi:RNA polymerase sigma-70 factor (ECF subfamily)